MFGVLTFGQLSLCAENILHEIVSCYSTYVSSVEEVGLNKERVVQQLQMVI